MQNAAGIGVSVPSEDRTNSHVTIVASLASLIQRIQQTKALIESVMSSYSATTSAVVIPPTLWGRDERSSLFLFPPTRGEGGAKRRVGVAHVSTKHPPPDTSFARLTMRHPPHKRWGRDEDRRCLCLCAKTALTASLRAGRNRLLTVIASASEAIHRAEKKVGLLPQ